VCRNEVGFIPTSGTAPSAVPSSGGVGFAIVANYGQRKKKCSKVIRISPILQVRQANNRIGTERLILAPFEVGAF